MIRRAWHLVAILWSYGLEEWLPRPVQPLLRPIRRLVPLQHTASRAVRLRLAFEHAGTLFIKFGQMLSTRRDLLPQELADELALLQDQVSPFPADQAMAIIESSLGQPLDAVFSEFDRTPLAAASIAQVHSAVLRHNQAQVVVKVIRPDITQTIEQDLALLRTLARLCETLIPASRRLRPQAVVADYATTLRHELNLQREAANTVQLRQNFTDSPVLYVPQVYLDLCHPHVMVMERIYGINVGDIAALKANGTNLQCLAERGVEVFFTQVFRDNFFHADMHPGNIFVALDHPDNPQWIGIDCGIMGSLTQADQRYLAENFLAFFNQDYRKVAQLHIDSGWVPPYIKVTEFESALRTVLAPIFQKSLAEISFGHVLLQLFTTARQFEMQVQPQLVLLQKTLLYIEGLGRQLYPQLDLWATAKPFLEDWMVQQTHPKRLWQDFVASSPQWLEQLPKLPHLVTTVLAHNEQHAQQRDHWFRAHQAQQQALGRALILLGMGCSLLMATLVWADTGFTLGLGCIMTGLCWLFSWQYTTLSRRSH